MITVITGGSGSGKSAYAEKIVTDFGDLERIYIATMFPFDEESHQRIARHRQMRAEKKFSTIECYTGLKNLKIPLKSCVLLECMSNLTANEMFQKDGAGEHTVEEILEGVRSLQTQAKELVIVTNEIFSDGISYDTETQRYESYLGEINQKIVGMAEMQKNLQKRRTDKWDDCGTVLRLRFRCIPKYPCRKVNGQKKICATLCAFFL